MLLYSFRQRSDVRVIALPRGSKPDKKESSGNNLCDNGGAVIRHGRLVCCIFMDHVPVAMATGAWEAESLLSYKA